MHLTIVHINVALKRLGVTFQTLGVILFRSPVNVDSVELVEFHVAFFGVALDILDRCCCDYVEAFWVLELSLWMYFMVFAICLWRRAFLTARTLPDVM